MKILLLLMIAVAVGLTMWLPRLHARSETHDATEYYRSWGGLRHPINLKEKITREQAEAQAAAGYAYMIAHYDTDGRLLRVVKMLRGAIFFEFAYAYYASGKLKSVRVTNPDGVVSVQEFEDRRRGFF